MTLLSHHTQTPNLVWQDYMERNIKPYTESTDNLKPTHEYPRIPIIPLIPLQYCMDILLIYKIIPAQHYYTLCLSLCDIYYNNSFKYQRMTLLSQTSNPIWQDYTEHNIKPYTESTDNLKPTHICISEDTDDTAKTLHGYPIYI